MLEASQRLIRVNGQGEGELGGIGINPAIKRHSELEIETLRNAPRDADKLIQLLKSKQRQNEEARHIEDTQRLATEIEMLEFLLCLMSRKQQEQ